MGDGFLSMLYNSDVLTSHTLNYYSDMQFAPALWICQMKIPGMFSPPRTQADTEKITQSNHIASSPQGVSQGCHL